MTAMNSLLFGEINPVDVFDFEYLLPTLIELDDPPASASPKDAISSDSASDKADFCLAV